MLLALDELSNVMEEHIKHKKSTNYGINLI